MRAVSAFTAMEYRAMPRPCTPHLSKCMVSSLEVTRGSNTRSCRAGGTPSPSSTMTMRRRPPSRDTAANTLLAWASRALRSISMTMSSVERMSWAACRRSASALLKRTKPSPRSASTRRWLSPLTFSMKASSEPSAMPGSPYFATPTARLSRMTTTFTWPGYCISFSMRCAMSCASTVVAASSTVSGSTITRTSRPA